MAKKYSTFIVGFREPRKQLLGFLNKTTGQPNMAEAMEVKMVVGSVQIPNYSVLWGRRVLDITNSSTSQQREKAKKVKSLSVNDPDYRGVIEFLKYGDPDGEAIECRFLPNSSSLDMQYQNNIQKLKLSDENALIDLKPGLNDFDETINATLVKFLKVHARNGDSVSRRNDMNEHDFGNYDANRIVTKEKDIMQIRQTALNLLFSTEGDNVRIEQMAIIQGLDAQQQPEILFGELMQLVKDDSDSPEGENARVFVSRFHQAQTNIKELIDKAEELKLLDVSLEGTIFITEKGQRVVLLDKLTQKGKGMYKELTDDPLNPRSIEAVRRIQAAHDAQFTSIGS